ncbi:MAG TPA: hypothetical protein PKU97_06180 [Kofleriaceae bacterium]|nr:hypothetical protein [Kofleriaceae bacterium]
MSSELVEAWTLREGERPQRGVVEQLRFLVRYAILAPSTHNSQPWKFRVTDHSVELWSDPSRMLDRIDPDRRQLFMSCGGALANLRIAMRRFGNSDQVLYLPTPKRPDHLATLHLGPPHDTTPQDRSLCDAITRRRTNRGKYEERALPDPVASQILEISNRPGCWMVELEQGSKREIADIVARADAQQLGDPSFREEFAQWLAPRGSRRRDGIPMAKKDLPSALPLAGTMILRRFDIGAGVAAREHELVTHSPMLTVLGTDEDTPLSWLIAGEAMQDAFLTATHLGVATSYLNQAIEEQELRPRVAAASGRGGFPQLILRWGYGPSDVPPTPRRALEDVLFE